MRIAIASDHAGYELKKGLLGLLQSTEGDLEHTFTDLGTNSIEPVDYPDFAQAVAFSILRGHSERGILICGSGVGVSVAANKFHGIRAGICHDSYSAHQGVEHDHMNVLVLGSRIVAQDLAFELVQRFLKAVESQAERHLRRLQKIEIIERNAA